MSIGYDPLHRNNGINKMYRKEPGRNPCDGDQGCQCQCSGMTVGERGVGSGGLKKGEETDGKRASSRVETWLFMYHWIDTTTTYDLDI